MVDCSIGRIELLALIKRYIHAGINLPHFSEISKNPLCFKSMKNVHMHLHKLNTNMHTDGQKCL